MLSLDEGQEQHLRAQLARRTNDEIASLNDSSVFSEFVCECSLQRCTARISLSREEYATIRSRPGWLIVLYDHWSPPHERVVREDARFLVIEKVGATARAIVSRASSGSQRATARRT
jgi:hypothetical protein